jgi:hypothetical protein
MQTRRTSFIGKCFNHGFLIIAAAVASLAPEAVIHAETIVLRSGNGTIGSTDRDISYFSSGDGAIGPFISGDRCRQHQRG